MKHRIRNIHLVGIGGSGMSGIAEVLLNQGYQVSGSDLNETSVTRRLERLGIRIFKTHDSANVEQAQADVLVTSTAISGGNPEVLAARAEGIPVVSRAMMLAELMRLKLGIAVAGTHGKTTTTSLVSAILAEAQLDPTFVIGGRLNSAGANAYLGKGDYIVVEADESDASFLNLLPVMAVITNIDVDHMDTYGHDIARLRTAFVQFTQNLPFYGSAILCLDDENVRNIIPFISRPISTYGFSEEADYQAVDVRSEGTQMVFSVRRRLGPKRPLTTLDVRLNLPGRHNVLNALAAIAVATEVGVEDEAIVTALEEFTGVGRRFSLVGELAVAPENATQSDRVDGQASLHGSELVSPQVPKQLADDSTKPLTDYFTLVDDYAHHPVEMEATIDAARGAWPDRRLVVVFQPHRYSRTRDCFEALVEVLGRADEVLLTEVYPAGELPLAFASGQALTQAIAREGHVQPHFIENVEDLPEAIYRFAQPGDVVITMGAGTIGRVPNKLMELAHGKA